MPIVWNPKARAEISPTKREDVDDDYKPGKPGPIWEQMRKQFAMRGQQDPITTTFVAGRANSAPALAALMEKCEPLARSETPPTFDDPAVAAAFTVLATKLAWNNAWNYVHAVAPSVPFAFETRIRSLALSTDPNYINWNNPFRLVAAPNDSSSVDKEWRAILLAQPDEIRAECKKIALALLPQANLGQRTTIAYTFFEEPLGDDVCRAWLKTANVNRVAPLNALVQDLELAKEIIANKDSAWDYFDLIERFGDAMLPLLVGLAEKPFDSYHARNVAEALALYDDPLAAEAMVKLLSKAPSRPHAIAYFSRFPHHAEAALASLDKVKGRAAKIAREVLEGAQRAHVGAVKPEDEAQPEDLPRIFVTPPWADDNKPKKPGTKLALERVDLPESIEWHDGEKERALQAFTRPDKPATKETLEDYAKQREAGKYVDVVKHKNEALPDDLVLSAWLEGQKTYAGMVVQKAQYVFAKFGDAAFPGLDAFGKQLAHVWGDPGPFLLRVKSWRLALPFAGYIAHRRMGKVAWLWLQKHAELAVLALVPTAFGTDKDDRATAERALFRLKASGVDVIAIGSRYGKEAKAALEKLFAWDPVYDLPKKIPQLGPSWNAQSVSRPTLVSNGKALPASALDIIATMLALSPLDPPYAGIAQIKEACDPHSLAEFAWETARMWEHAGHKKKEIWMLNSLVHFADDEIVRRLTPGMRVDYAVQVLEIIGTDAALMEMATIAGRTESQGSEWTLGGRIEKLLESAAEARGVTKDELEEDLAPTADLDEDGMLILDYGPRKVVVGFDESLVPYVKNEAGVKVRALAPARKDDDPVKAERAKTIWRDLKEDVTVIAQRRIVALERALSTNRQWTLERFRRVWLDHRLMKHLARGVIWSDGKTPFRVAEDGSLSDVNEHVHVLADNAKIGVAHPLRMSTGDVDKWRTILEDYKIVQPFAQLARQYEKIEPTATRTPWTFGKATWQELMARLNTRGYTRGPNVPGKYSYVRYLRGGRVQFEFTVTKEGVDGVFVFKNGDDEVPAAKLDAIELADAIHDLSPS